MEALTDAVEIAGEIGAAHPFQAWRKGEAAPGPGVRTRDDLPEYIRRAVHTYHHQVRTCRMGIGDEAVVTPDLKVRGLDAGGWRTRRSCQR